MITQVAGMNAADIAQVVRRHAEGVDFAEFGLSVLADEIRQDGDWWYVPLRPAHPFRRSFMYHAVLADLEEEIDEQEGLNILLVPCS